MAPGIALELADSATILGPPPPPLLCRSLLNLGFFPRTSFWPWLKMSSFALLQPTASRWRVAPSHYPCHCPQVHSPLLPCVPPPRLYCSTDCQTKCPLSPYGNDRACLLPPSFPAHRAGLLSLASMSQLYSDPGAGPFPKAYTLSDTICSHGSVCVFCLLSMVQQRFKLRSSTHSISSSNCFRPLTAVLRKPGQRPCLLHWG